MIRRVAFSAVFGGVLLMLGAMPGEEVAWASAPPHCDLQRGSYCIWSLMSEVRLKPQQDGQQTFNEIMESTGLRHTRVIEPWRCGDGPADTIPPYPAPSAIRRSKDGWLHFTLRLRRDGSCDLEVAQQVPVEEQGGQYDRLMWLPFVICLGEARAAYPGHAKPFPKKFTRTGRACSLKY